MGLNQVCNLQRPNVQPSILKRQLHELPSFEPSTMESSNIKLELTKTDGRTKLFAFIFVGLCSYGSLGACRRSAEEALWTGKRELHFKGVAFDVWPHVVALAVRCCIASVLLCQ